MSAVPRSSKWTVPISVFRDNRLSLKLELLQHAGSFKTRGAFSNLLTRRVPEAGVIAASGGNHGAAVAYAAHRLGKPATIFVPTVSSPAKVARIRGYGANLVIWGDRYADALAESERFAGQSGALPIHAYDQPETLMGTGTVGLEFEAQDPAIDSLLVAVGGGGLIGGIAAWYEGRVRVIGVEPVAAPTLTRALEAGRPVDAEAGGIAADSLAPKRVGELMFPLAQRFVEQVVLVEDDAIQTFYLCHLQLHQPRANSSIVMHGDTFQNSQINVRQFVNTKIIAMCGDGAEMGTASAGIVRGRGQNFTSCGNAAHLPLGSGRVTRRSVGIPREGRSN